MIPIFPRNISTEFLGITIQTNKFASEAQVYCISRHITETLLSSSGRLNVFARKFGPFISSIRGGAQADELAANTLLRLKYSLKTMAHLLLLSADQVD